MTEHNEQKQGMKSEPDVRQPYLAEDEIDLLELVRPLWRQKILIAAITFLTIAAAVVLVLQATPSYRIYTQLKPGVCRWDDKGNPIPYLKTIDLKSLLTGGIFNTYASEAGLGDTIPKIEAAGNRQGNQLTAYFFWPDRDEGKKVMAGFIDFLNNPARGANQDKLSGLQIQRLSLEKSIRKFQEDIKAANVRKEKVEMNSDRKKEELKLVDLQSDRLAREIESVNADVKMTEEEIRFLEERIAVAGETRGEYEKSRREIEENTSKIIALRDKLLQDPPDDTLQLLLLASTIQQNIAYLNTLGQKIDAARKEVISLRTTKADKIKEQGKYRLAIADLQDKIDQEIPKQKADIKKEIAKLQLTVKKEIPSKIALLNQEINERNDKISTVSMVEVVESPQASIKPEKPKKRKIVALAGIMGVLMAIIIAYLRHFWIANRTRLREEES